MDLQLLDNILGISGIIFVAIVVQRLSGQTTKQFDAIRTAGSNSWFGSWWAGITFLKNAKSVIQEGYDKSAPFKVAEVFKWRVIVCDRKHLEELAKASDDEFSALEAIENLLQMKYTLGRKAHHIPRYLPFVSSCLSRKIEVIYSEVGDEIVTSFSKVLDLTENEWRSVPALSTIKEVVCRASNRAFVGPQLSHDPDWIHLSNRCTYDLITGGYLIGLLPKFARSLAVRYFTKMPRTIAHFVDLLGPVIEERKKYLHKCRTEWDDKPNDLLMWLMEDARDSDELTAECLIVPLLLCNVSALSTISNSFTQALFRLATNPQYIQPLREEVEAIVGNHGWSKVALDKMRKVDSFLKECQRTQSVNTVTLARTALKDFAFSDGTFIPKGTWVAAASQSIHHDEKYYANPDVFEPFRFVDAHEDSGGVNRQFVSTSVEFLPFGHGRHACPGRFLAVCEMKFMLAYVVMTYDVKLSDGAVTVPPHLPLGLFSGASPHAEVMFRNRVD